MQHIDAWLPAACVGAAVAVVLLAVRLAVEVTL
jgi:hypothetical protein